MSILDLIYWDPSYNKYLLINLAIALALFTSLRWLSGWIAHINPSKELLKKDNPAFGISMAGVVFGVTIVLTGAIYGDPIYNMTDSVKAVGAYGLIGIFLMATTRLVFDKIALPRISISDEIVKGNVAAGIVDAGNVIATAIVIRAVMTWVESNTWEGIMAVFIGYLISQVLLTAATFFRVKIFSFRHEGKTLQDNLHDGNIALALHFSGRRIGTAFAIAAASNLMVYEIYDINKLLMAWTLVSIVMTIVLRILSYIADISILYHVNITRELLKQRNIALGILQCMIYISIGMLLAELTT